MAGSGYSKTSGVLSLLKIFDEETNFFVWKQALSALNTITEAWSFEDKPVKDGLKVLRNDLVSKCLSKKGWDFKDAGKVEQMFKALMFSNSGEDPEVIRPPTTQLESSNHRPNTQLAKKPFGNGSKAIWTKSKRNWEED